MAETKMDRHLALEAVRVTEIAALSASRLMGRGDEKAADQAAVDAMRQALNALASKGPTWVRMHILLASGRRCVKGFAARSRACKGWNGILRALARTCLTGGLRCWIAEIS